MLLDGHQVGQRLGGMEFVGQAVPYRHARILGQVVHDALAEAAVFNAVVHAAQHARGIGDALLFADLRARGIEIGGVHAQVGRRHLEGAARARAGFFKDQRCVLALAQPVRNARLFLLLQLRRQPQKPLDLPWRVIQQR